MESENLNWFFACSLLGAIANLGIYLADSLVLLLVLRFSTGFILAGIYPVGMKIAAGWYRKGLGQALGYLVGALVMGTAFPHLLKSSGQSFPWEYVIITITVISAFGGILMLLLVPDGPYTVKGTAFSIGFFITILSIQFTNFFIIFLGPEFIFLFLVPGPILGLVSLWPLYRRHSQTGTRHWRIGF